jgi:hypothetical protein
VTAATRRWPKAPGTRPPDAFARVATQVDALAAAFGLDAEARALAHAVFGAVCGRALAFSLGEGPVGLSRLNEDGTPVQFATSVGASAPAFRFVADPGPFDTRGEARMRGARHILREAAELIGVEAELASISPLLLELAPENAPALRDDPAGAYWIGAAFARGAVPRLRVYVNVGWGSAAAQRARLHRFAAHFDRTETWDKLATQIPPALTPLGLALTLAPGEEDRGAIYLRAYGLRLTDYVALASTASGPANAERIRAFGAALLGADAAHPTPSAVLSLAFGSGPGLPAELEFCAHCLYADDAAARAELERLFTSARVDATPYHTLARVLSPRHARPGPPRVHSFIGVDAKSAAPAYTVYMKPDLSVPQ